jgi:hypothetical protein
VTEREDALDGIIEILKEPAGLAPDLTQRVMSEIDRLPPHGTTVPSRVGWWRRHWTIRLSPVRGLALSAGLAVLLVAVFLAGRRESPAAQPTAGYPGGRPTQFVLIAPEASAVTLVGDFNDWSMAATPLVRAEGGGVWSVTVPLVPGRYRYAFVVNGTIWQNDPEAAAAEDEFGRSNSVLTVGGGT